MEILVIIKFKKYNEDGLNNCYDQGEISAFIFPETTQFYVFKNIISFPQLNLNVFFNNEENANAAFFAFAKDDKTARHQYDSEFDFSPFQESFFKI